MPEKNNYIPPPSCFELQRQASIQRNLVIQAGMRSAVRAAKKRLRMLVLRITQLARGLVAEGRRRELQRLDDSYAEGHRCPARRDRIRGT
jgi:hypothetical protein